MNWIEIVIGAFAVIAGLLHIVNGRTIERYAVARGFLGAQRAVKLSALLLIAAGITCFIPDVARYGGYGIAGFLVISSLTVHKFWEENDRLWRFSEGLHVLKNITFAVLLIFYFM